MEEAGWRVILTEEIQVNIGGVKKITGWFMRATREVVK